MTCALLLANMGWGGIPVLWEPLKVVPMVVILLYPLAVAVEVEILLPAQTILPILLTTLA